MPLLFIVNVLFGVGGHVLAYPIYRSSTRAIVKFIFYDPIDNKDSEDFMMGSPMLEFQHEEIVITNGKMEAQLRRGSLNIFNIWNKMSMLFTLI